MERSLTPFQLKLIDRMMSDPVISLDIRLGRGLREMKEFATKTKAQIVFDKCLAAGKLQIAHKIAMKYNVLIRDQFYDTVVAMGLAIIASRHQNSKS